MGTEGQDLEFRETPDLATLGFAKSYSVTADKVEKDKRIPFLTTE